MGEGWKAKERKGRITGKEKSDGGSRYMLRFAPGTVQCRLCDGERNTIIYRGRNINNKNVIL